MATITSPVATPTARRRMWKIFLRTAAVLVLLAFLFTAACGYWFFHAARASLPQLDGNIAVSGLTGPVSVVRDTHGVPHLTAASLNDLFVAQGYVTAQDRLWQMDMTRRFAGGEMAEILPASSAPAPRVSRSTSVVRQSPGWVQHDKQQRILRLRAVADRVAAQLPERDRKFFAAYAAGVNAYINEHRDNLPIEFRILRYAPREWTVSDSVLVGISMSQLLNPQYEMEYWREK